jgi:hypothetical protein
VQDNPPQDFSEGSIWISHDDSEGARAYVALSYKSFVQSVRHGALVMHSNPGLRSP